MRYKITFAIFLQLVLYSCSGNPNGTNLNTKSGNYILGKKVWTNNCSPCHFIPDPAVKYDAIWFNMLQTTSWVGAHADSSSDEVRSGLINYLSAQTPPEKIDSRSESRNDTGTISLFGNQGSVFIVPINKGEGGKPLRIVWSKDDIQNSKPVPAGTYRVKNCVTESDNNGETWAVSYSNAQVPNLTITQEKDVELKLDLKLRLKTSASIKNNKLKCSAWLLGQNDSNVSLMNYSKGGIDKRLPVVFKVYSVTGKQIHKSVMSYGWGGQLTAVCNIDKDCPPVKIKIEIESGPFSVSGEREIDIK